MSLLVKQHKNVCVYPLVYTKYTPSCQTVELALFFCYNDMRSLECHMFEKF